ncbi:MAG: acetyl-CoA carboxylase carboxyltransferase subunit alpha [Candidatus Methylacidiphilales bacterium]|nr:acetyl-CoA carboxylase carboxyltransferase subunit alpha [Candidatus Methylacidiphilales bacterium]
MSAQKKRLLPLEFEKPVIELENLLADLHKRASDNDINLSSDIASLQARIEEERQKIYSNLTPWQRVQIVRHVNRPFSLDFLKLIASDYTELSGDRLHANDKALIGGFATIDGHRIMVVAHQKGRDTKEKLMRNWGCPNPEGYRKALRLMKMASKFRLPVVALIDTPGAFPGLASEERHVAEAIAVNLREMFGLEVPVIAAVLGEGGSGGALGIGVADRVLIMENAYYSVISPEGCAAILWKDRAHAPRAAEALKMTSPDLMTLGLVDEVIPEPLGGAHHDWETSAASLKSALIRNLQELSVFTPEQLMEGRYDKFRAYGRFEEEAAVAAV